MSQTLTCLFVPDERLTMSSFLTNDDYLIITRLLSFFSSSYGGRNARLQLIQTLDNSMSVCTSISSRIQYQLKCRHLISRLLSAAILKQTSIYHDGGLYFSIIFCNFLIQFREINSNKKLSLFDSCLDLIDQMNIPTEIITFDSIHQLMAMVRAVICKSLAYNNSDLLREQICLLSVKSFLENITSQQQLILTIEGLSTEESTLFNGLVYQTSIINSSLCSEITRLCLYFTISLAGDYTIEDVDHIETEKQMFEWIQTTADRISKQIIEYTHLHNGGLILCQKVIHPSVKIKLKQYGINTIDRLGRQYTPYFCYLTGKGRRCFMNYYKMKFIQVVNPSKR
jgi:McKusick-Kaufman syndrome protein